MKAFISYSHKDAELLDALHSHLGALRRQDLIITWTDREIPAGGIIDEHVDHHLEDAELYLFLISAAFISSNYCYEKEFQRALKLHAAKKAIIIPIILKPCDWEIPELRKFKALPKDGKAVTGSDWKNVDEALADVVAGIRKVIERGFSEPAKPKFVPDSRHVSDEQRAILKGIGDEVVERLTAHLAKLPDEERKKKVGKFHGIFWWRFGEEFKLEDGIKSLLVEKFDAAKVWLQQQRAINDKKLVRSNPQKFRNTLIKTIWGIASSLGWDSGKVHAFAADKVEYAEPLKSLNELGNKQLEIVRDRIRYEATKRGVRASQSKAKKKSGIAAPQLPLAKDLLEAILAHPIPEERGLTEILRDSPVGPLETCFIANTTGRGSAPSVKKSILRPAIAELIRLGWLLPPEQDDSVRIYELNSAAQSQ